MIMQMGILNLTIEEKVADLVFQQYGNNSPNLSKSELVKMIRPILAIYQEGLTEGVYKPFNGEIFSDGGEVYQENNQKIRSYIYQRSGIDPFVIITTMNALYIGVQNGIISVKEIDPTLQNITRETSAINTAKAAIEQYTPKTIASILNFDVPEFISKNLLTIAGLGIVSIIIINQLKKPLNAQAV